MDNLNSTKGNKNSLLTSSTGKQRFKLWVGRTAAGDNVGDWWSEIYGGREKGTLMIYGTGCIVNGWRWPY